MVPTLSVTTAGAISYPLIYSRGKTSSISSISPNQISVNQPLPFKHSEQAISGDTSLKLSSSVAANVNAGKILKSPQVTTNQLEVATPDVELSLQDKAISLSTSEVVGGVQEQITKEEAVNELSSQQLKQFQEAITFIEESKQGYQVIVEKVNEYRNTPSASFHDNYIRNLKDSEEQEIFKKHRESLYEFFVAFSKLDDYKNENLSALDNILKNVEENEDLQETTDISFSKVLDALSKIGWMGDQVQLPVSDKELKELAWDKWETNPYSAFYVNEGLWKNKIQKIQDALVVFKANSPDKKECSDSHNTERSAALQKFCKLDSDMLQQVIRGLKSEIELDVASWLLKKMKQIHEARMRRR